MSLRITLLAAMALSTSAAAGEVNIYSTRQPELIEPVLAAFTEATGIAINLAFVKEGLIERLKAEGDRSPADLVLTTDISNLSRIVEAGVTQAVSSDLLNVAVPVALRDADGHWYALTSRARIVYASVDRVTDGDVTTYEDLSDPKWAGRICSRSGTHSYNLSLMAGIIAHNGEAAASAWAAGVKANLARAPQGNDRAQVKAIWAGECDISLGNTYYMGLMMGREDQQAWANSVRIIFPTFENGGTHVNISGIAMTSAAPNYDEALLLMEFLVSPEAQRIYAELNSEYPVLEAAQPSEIVAAWGEFSADTTPLSELAANRAAALRIMEEVDFDG